MVLRADLDLGLKVVSEGLVSVIVKPKSEGKRTGQVLLQRLGVCDKLEA